MDQRDLAIVGPTGSGKSALAMEVARRLGDIEIVSIDSMQVYRGMDIGTAKPTADERDEVPHHMIDLTEPSSEVSLADFSAVAKTAIREIRERGNRVLLVGGTGLYFQCVVEDFELPGRFPEIAADLDAESTEALHARLVELDPNAASNMESTNRRRVLRALEVTLGSGRAFSSFGPGIDTYSTDQFRIQGIWIPRSLNSRRISDRVEQMLHAGWVDEVKALQVEGLSKTAAQALGYKELIAFLDGERDIDNAAEEIFRRTKSFARRQRMWFRRDPRVSWKATSQDPSLLLPSLLREWASS